MEKAGSQTKDRDKSDCDRLCHMRTAGNNLAHGDTVSYTELQQPGSVS